MPHPKLNLEREIGQVTRQLAGVEAQLATAIETYLDHQSQDPTAVELSMGRSRMVTKQETEANLLRPGKSNVAIIKIESDLGSSNRGRARSQCSSKVTLNSDKKIINQRKSEITQSQSFTGGRRNSRSQSVRVNCSQGQQIKINNKNCELPPAEQEEEDAVVVTPPRHCNENIVRRSKSVVIHCNTRDINLPGQTLQGKTNPVICDTKHDASEDQHDDCLSMKENLDDIKLEIERLITEREQFLKENSVLKFYKRAFHHLQVENGQLREEIVRLQDKDPSETRAGGHILVRSSPDGQDIDRAECEEMELRSGVSQEGEEEEGGQMNGDPGEINRWTRTPLAGSDQHERSAVPELIILGDVQADHTATLQLNNTTREIHQPEKLEDLYQDITKNVLKKIVKIRNLKNAIV